MKELYNKVKRNNIMSIVLEKNGSFYKIYNRDALIIWYLFKYKIMGNVVSFPVSVYRKIINELNHNNISVIVINNKIIKEFKVSNNNYFKYLLKAYEELESNNKIIDLDNLIKSKIKLDTKNYKKIKDFIDSVWYTWFIIGEWIMLEEFNNKFQNNEYISKTLYKKVKEQKLEITNNFNIDKYNEQVLEKDYLKYKDYFENMYKGIDDNIHLDKEQIKAILTDEDYSLILAGAGTGKTTTMASKVKYLVDIKHINPAKIAVMSFTKKATEELENRIKVDFNIPANTTTFHSLGYSYIKEIFKTHKCYIVDSQIRNKIFINYFKENIFPFKYKIEEIFKIFKPEEINKSWLFSKFFKENYDKFNTFDEYFEYYKKVKINEIDNLEEFVENRILKDINKEDYPTTIKGELVKSAGEARIANFLYRNSIDYEYEKIYKELMEDNTTYKPDFTLNLGGEEVYIEFFGLSSYDESSTDIKKYNTIRKKKEKYHREHHTKFISIDYIKGQNIEETLKFELQKLGFTLKPKTYIEIYNRILDNNEISTFYPFKDFLYELIDLLKSSNKRNNYVSSINEYININPSEVQEEMIKQYEYFKEFYKYYQDKLYGNSEEYGFDFSDMFYYATKYMENLNKTNLQFDYIIIDEYQDISKERYMFTKKISDLNNSKVIAVGDDWQSIFAFAGSKIRYIYDFEKYFEGSKLLRITNTYRNSQELINYSGSFIMKNNDQIKKELISEKSINHPIKFVKFKDDNEYLVLKRLIKKIHLDNPSHKILILSRINKNIEMIFEDDDFKDGIDTKIEFIGYENLDIDGMSIHKSKGLTSDEVILIGLDNSFPLDKRNTFWLKAIFKEDIEKESIPFAEERRLFYVALTRTKNYVYLLVNEDTKKRSPFVNEIYNIIVNENNEKNTINN